MKWQRITDDLIASGPYYIRRCKTARGVRFLLGRGQECLGGWDTAEEAKEAAREAHRQQ